jgi:prepilin signal peptidase PulO-like enzyme (type II secretory pathway)
MAAFVLAIGLAPVPLIGKIIGIPIALLLVCIAVYDFRTTYIPDRWVYSLALLTFVYAFASSSVLAPWYVVLLSGPVVALPLYLLWLVSAGAWMGLGDAKLALGFGWLLGIVGGYLALGLAFVLGAVVGCTLIGITRFAAAGRGFTMKSEVPFGPFLILSLCIVWCSQLYGLGLLVALARFLSLS